MAGQVAGKHTEEVEVQEDPVARHENFPISMLHGLQERVDHLSSFGNQLLKSESHSR